MTRDLQMPTLEEARTRNEAERGLLATLRDMMPPEDQCAFDKFLKSIGCDPLLTKARMNCPTCGEPVNSIFDHIDRDCEAE